MAEMKENMAPATAPPARTSDIAVIGLAVMGQNLILNMNDNGFVVTAYNRTTAKVDEFLANEAKGTKIVGAHSIEEMCATLKAPRRIMLLVKAGAPVDQFIEAVLPHTEPGDILIDGGNSLFSDTIRRTAHVEAQGRLFIGTGVSGGEEGARTGPSIMPGGRCRCSRRLSTATFTTASLTSAASSCSAAAWPHVKQIFQAISAKAGKGDEPCCQWVGGGGAGHYVKMVQARRVSDTAAGGARPTPPAAHAAPPPSPGPQRHRVRRHAADLRGVPGIVEPPRKYLRNARAIL